MKMAVEREGLRREKKHEEKEKVMVKIGRMDREQIWEGGEGVWTGSGGGGRAGTDSVTGIYKT